MRYSIVNLQDISLESTIFRLDSEFFHPEILSTKKWIRSKAHSTLRKIGSTIIHPSEVKRKYEETGIQILLAQNIRDNFLDFSIRVFMAKKLENLLKKNRLEYGDIALTRSGANYGQCAPYLGLPSKIFACADDLVIKNIKIPGTYLSTYLNTSFGKNLIESCKYGGSQPHIAPQALYDIPIYTPSDKLIRKIDRQVKNAFELTKKSEATYRQAQTLLLSELGLANWKPKHQLTFVRNYSDTQRAGRMDADYFQPKYEEIINTILSYSGGWDTLGNLAYLKNENFKPKSKTEYRYIELANIAGNGEITDCMTTRGRDLPSRARRKVSVGDVIVSSIEGSLDSSALIKKEYDEALCSTGFHVINSGVFNSETLLVLMKSIVGQLQLKKGCSGTILTAINKDEFTQIVLPIIAQKKQIQIQQKVTESFNSRKQSKHLLECAKRAVEMAIEQDEQTAIDWLENERNCYVPQNHCRTQMHAQGTGACQSTKENLGDQ